MQDSHDYYQDLLREQLSLLIDACNEYDKGKFYYSKQMSAIIRTLVKDNPRNKQTVSLLSSLGIKNRILFFNTAYSARNPAVMLNLVGIFNHYRASPDMNEIPIYVPMLDDTGLVDVQWIEFDDWWESNVIVCRDTKNNFSLSRKKIILTMAEQHGGVHVDSYDKMDAVYKSIINGVANIMTHVTTAGKASNIAYLMNALVRQIAHELIITLQTECDKLTMYQPTQDFLLRGVPSTKIIKPFMIALNDGDLSTRTDTPINSERGPGIKVPEGVGYLQLVLKD